MNADERTAERRDAFETIAALEGGLLYARHALAEHCWRSREMYGKRQEWPSSSEMAARDLERKIAELVLRRDGAIEHHTELFA